MQTQGDEPTSEIDNLIGLEQRRLATVLKRVQKQMLLQLQSLRNTVEQSRSKIPVGHTPLDRILQMSLPFSDKARHLREKLNNTLPYKQFISNTQMELSKTCVLDKEEERQAKTNFDLICDYKKREEFHAPGKDLYTNHVCKHLVRKTFKKTAHDIYQTVAATQFSKLEGDCARIACIGGGPGSDFCGLVACLLQLGFRRFQGVIFDYNHQKWQGTAEGLQTIMASEAKKLNMAIEVHIEWRYIDMTDPTPQSTEQIVNVNPHVVTCCWALNEDTYVPKFWSQIVDSLRSTAFVFIDGNRFPLEHLLQLKGGRQVQYSPLQSPRSLIMHSNTQ